MDGFENVFTALRDTVLKQLGPLASEDGGSVVAFEYGTPIPEDTFRLNDPARTLSPALALEFMSAHADTLPEVADGLFRRRTVTVEGQYEAVLAGATPLDAASAPMLGAVKRAAERDFDDETPSLQPGAGSFRPVIATPFNWFDQNAAGNWTKISIGAGDRPEPPPEPRPDPSPRPRRPFRIDPSLLKWRVVPEDIKDALRDPPPVEFLKILPLDTVRPSVEIARPERLDLQSLVRPRAGFARTLPVRNLVAGDLAVAGVAGATASGRGIALRQVLDSVMAEDQSTVPQGVAPRQWLRFTNADDLVLAIQAIQNTSEAKPVTSQSFSISFSLCFVQLRRPWLSRALLDLPNWFLPNWRKGGLSEAGSGSGPMAFLPTGCILIRDLAIEGHWSSDDRAALDRFSALGPFSLIGREVEQGSAAIKVSGMQSIGWLCERMPTFPPVDDPALGPQ